MNPVILSGIVSVAKEALTKLFQTDEDKAKVAAVVDKMTGDLSLEVDKLKAELMKSDAVGNPLQRSWRPILMLGFGGTLVLILLINFALFPMMSVFGKVPPFVIVPEEIWDVLYLISGGCVLGRSGEKITAFIKRK